MQITKLTAESILPLTCSRAGTCCFGNRVMLNPWELHRLSKEKKITTREFRDLYCELGGIRLKFNGKTNQKGEHSCSQYVENFGCSVHSGRPLACRLFPLGRQVQSNEAHYMHQGAEFPCLNECSAVLELPKMSVSDYLRRQQTDAFEKAQDEYLIVMQNIADIGFELLLDSGLSKSGDTKTLRQWRELGNISAEELTERISQEWLDCLILPEIEEENPISFVQMHNEILLLKAQEKFGNLQTLQEVHEASVVLISVALQLARGLGADAREISEHWIETARRYGAQE